MQQNPASATGGSGMENYIKLLRPRHWVKNFLIFFPVIFYRSTAVEDYLKVLLGVICFSALASSVYVFNDIRDRNKDRLHARKCQRPIASGAVSVRQGYIIGAVLSMCALLTSFMLGSYPALGLSVIYFAINMMYSFGLKNKTIIDVVILSSGFVMRVLYGGAIVHIKVSAMLLLTVFMFSLYMGLGKRRNEKRKTENDTREVLKLYSDTFLDRNMYMSLTLGVVFYSIWALSLGEYMIYTTIFVVIICMRYNFILESDSLGDPVDVVFADKILMIMIFLFALMLLVVLGIL